MDGLNRWMDWIDGWIEKMDGLNRWMDWKDDGLNRWMDWIDGWMDGLEPLWIRKHLHDVLKDGRIICWRIVGKLDRRKVMRRENIFPVSLSSLSRRENIALSSSPPTHPETEKSSRRDQNSGDTRTPAGNRLKSQIVRGFRDREIRRRSGKSNQLKFYQSENCDSVILEQRKKYK